MPTTAVETAAALSFDAQVAEQRRLLDACFAEVGKRIVGQQPMIRGMMMALLAGGHVLLEGMSGLAKTRAVKALAEVIDVGPPQLTGIGFDTGSVLPRYDDPPATLRPLRAQVLVPGTLALTHWRGQRCGALSSRWR